MENERELLRITRLDGMTQIQANCESGEDIFYLASALFDVFLKSRGISRTINALMQKYADDPNFRQQYEEHRVGCPDLVNLLKKQAQ